MSAGSPGERVLHGLLLEAILRDNPIPLRIA